jgi:hypothetical protein
MQKLLLKLKPLKKLLPLLQKLLLKQKLQLLTLNHLLPECVQALRVIRLSRVEV